MIQWILWSEDENRLVEAISLAFGRHDDLIDFLFDPDSPRLRTTSGQLIHESASLSSGERLLIRIALDIWNSSGNVKIRELFCALDQEDFENVLLALQYLGTDSSCLSWKEKTRASC